MYELFINIKLFIVNKELELFFILYHIQCIFFQMECIKYDSQLEFIGLLLGFQLHLLLMCNQKMRNQLWSLVHLHKLLELQHKLQ
jgi:hypothetical protein